jgi:A/G-specific adenine glycosylase
MIKMHVLDSNTLDQIRKDLVSWFYKNARSLPWRVDLITPNRFYQKMTEETNRTQPQQEINPVSINLRDPYKTWISEIMLQQTQVVTVVRYFNEWMIRFPTIEALALADESEILQSWAGLGYYSRARNIHKTAKDLVNHHNGELPRTRVELLSLSGIGDYTAGAILSLAMGQTEAILDGNCIRVLSRLHRIDFFPVKRNELQEYWTLAKVWADHPEPQSVNEAIMELGASICKPLQADCKNCPLQSHCPSSHEELWKKFPPPQPKRKWKEHSLTTFIVEADEQIVLVNNSDFSFLAKNHTFPAVSWDEGMDEMKHRLGNLIMASSLSKKKIKHTITHHKLEFQVLYVKLENKEKWDQICTLLDLQFESEQWHPRSQLPLVTKLSQKIWESI